MHHSSGLSTHGGNAARLSTIDGKRVSLELLGRIAAEPSARQAQKNRVVRGDGMRRLDAPAVDACASEHAFRRGAIVAFGTNQGPAIACFRRVHAGRLTANGDQSPLGAQARMQRRGVGGRAMQIGRGRPPFRNNLAGGTSRAAGGEEATFGITQLQTSAATARNQDDEARRRDGPARRPTLSEGARL